MFTLKLLIFISICVNFSEMKTLPDYLKKFRCAKNTKFNECFIKNGNEMIPIVTKGIPELDIPNMMPLQLQFLQLINEPQLKLNLTKIEVYGLDRLKILGSSQDIPKGILGFKLRSDNLTILGEYKSDGKLALLPIKGEGKFSINFKNGVYQATITCKMINKNGEDYFKRLQTDLNLDFEKVVFNFQNLFEKDNHLGDTVNEFLNENWKTLLKDYGPSIIELLKTLIGEGLFDKFAVVSINNLYDTGT